MLEISSTDKEAIVSGDFNKVHIMEIATNRLQRGKDWGVDLHSERYWLQRREPNLVRDQSESHVDINLATAKIEKKVRNWRIMNDEGLTLQKCITFEIHEAPPKYNSDKKEIFFDAAGFKHQLDITRHSVSCTPKSLTKAIHIAQRKATSEIKGRSNLRPYWWNQTIERSWADANIASRALTRARAGTDSPEQIANLEDHLKISKKRLKTEINACQGHPYVATLKKK